MQMDILDFVTSHKFRKIKIVLQRYFIINYKIWFYDFLVDLLVWFLIVFKIFGMSLTTYVCGVEYSVPGTLYSK